MNVDLPAKIIYNSKRKMGKKEEVLNKIERSFKANNPQLKFEYHPKFEDSMNRLFSNNLRYAIPRKIRDVWHLWHLRKRIKWAWQRLTRGWDDTVAWNLSDYLARMLPGVLADIAENADGHPAGLDKKITYGTTKSLKEWKQVLKKMGRGFKAAESLMVADDKLFLKGGGVNVQARNKAMDEFNVGMDLFKEYFFSLWD